jgi:hypothetical protein
MCVCAYTIRKVFHFAIPMRMIGAEIEKREKKRKISVEKILHFKNIRSV